MTARVFVDTNVLVYSRDTTEPEKNAAALRWLNVLWADQCGQTSFQVLNEYYAVVTRKLDRPLPRKQAREDVLDLLAWNPVTMNEPLLVDAWRLQERFRLSWWDALIVAAARAANCGLLLTEDLQTGQRIDDMTIISPFQSDPATTLS